MIPTFHDGDIVLARRVWVNFEKPVIGKIYFFHKKGRRMIKRLTELTRRWNFNFCYFEGDNALESYDSRNFGWVRWKSVEWVYIKLLFKNC